MGCTEILTTDEFLLLLERINVKAINQKRWLDHFMMATLQVKTEQLLRSDDEDDGSDKLSKTITQVRFFDFYPLYCLRFKIITQEIGCLKSQSTKGRKVVLAKEGKGKDVIRKLSNAEISRWVNVFISHRLFKIIM